MASEWNMPRRGEACVGCRRGFEVGEAIQALLYATEAGYERRDYCLECRPPETPAPLGVWRTRRPEPVVSKVQRFDREAVYSFFERLEGAREPDQVQFRFVLALLLWRKKVLKLERTTQADGHEVWEFVATRSGTAYQVARPELDEAQLERLSTQLERLLAGQAGEVEVVVPEAGKEAEDVP